MSMNAETVKHIAGLSRLAVDESSLALYAKQLEAIMNYVDTISQLDLSSSVETVNLPFVDVLDSKLTRPDYVVQEADSNLKLFLASSLNRHESYFRSPKAL